MRPTRWNVALSVAGVAVTVYAAATLPPHSVGTRQLRDRAVTAAKLGVLPAARLESSTQEIPSDAPTTITFSDVAFDTGGVVPAGNQGLRAPRSGIYAVDAGLRFPADARGIRAAFVVGPGNRYIANHEDSANADKTRSTIFTVSTLVRLRRGEAVSFQAFQNTGAPMRLVADARSFLDMHFVTAAGR